jgi:hypothetical protein
MGYLTTITFYNDAYGEFQEYPERVAEIIAEAMNSHVAKSYPIGSHANYVTSLPTRHASEFAIYIHSDNGVREMNPYSKETVLECRRHPEYFKITLDRMKREIKDLEALWRETTGKEAPGRKKKGGTKENEE